MLKRRVGRRLFFYQAVALVFLIFFLLSGTLTLLLLSTATENEIGHYSHLNQKLNEENHFLRIALLLAMNDMSRHEEVQRLTGQDKIHKVTLLCGFHTSWTLNACKDVFLSVWRGLNREELRRRKMVLWLLQHLVLKRIDSPFLVEKDSDFLRGSRSDILQRLPKLIQSMQDMAHRDELNFPSPHDLHEELLWREAEWGASNMHLETVRNVSYIFTEQFSDVLVAAVNLFSCASIITSHNHSSLEADVSTMIGAAKTTYLLLNEYITMSANSDLINIIIKVIVHRGCEYTLLQDAENRQNDKTDGRPLVIRAECPRNVDAFTVNSTSRKQSAPEWSSFWDSVVNTENRKPLLCERFSDPLVITKVLKFGEKTVVLKGLFLEEEVLVKVLHPYYYFSFVGFRDFIAEEKTRSPLIHYPKFSCFSFKYGAIFQVQSFVKGSMTLLKFSRDNEMQKKISVQQRMEIAMQILCIFHFLHEVHPLGFFVYDDNHPTQYLIKEEGDGHFSVRLIDIDTLQLTETRSISNSVYPYNNYSAVCRCFACRGRSSCFFFNTKEAYDACGQIDYLEQWRSESPRLMKRGRLCDGSRDMWFEAQLLYLLFEGTVAWENVERTELLHMIQSNFAPTFTNKNSLLSEEASKKMEKLLSLMFISRPMETTVIKKLRDLCDTLVGCRLPSECPAPVPSSHGAYSTPLQVRFRE